jgi:hypothetical protein
MKLRDSSKLRNLVVPTVVLGSLLSGSGALAEPSGLRIGGEAQAWPVPIFKRRSLTSQVAAYSAELRVGPGPFDVIGLHRVIRERAPHRPIATSHAVMLVHGDVWSFDAAFLKSGPSPEEDSIAVYLADNAIDVWGVDLGWTRVPAATTDFSFMRGWGIERDARDLAAALAAARLARLATGSGFGKVNLLGWSRGGMIGYAHLDAETRVPEPLRQVSGFIPVDIYLKTDAEDLRRDACDRLAAARDLLDRGVHTSDSGGLLAALGQLAVEAPSAPSPIFPAFDNRGAAVFAGGATFRLLPKPPVPAYHLTGAIFDAAGLPVDLDYTAPERWFAFLAKASAHQPLQELADADAAICDDPQIADVPFDDHLRAITVPVLYVGAGGGFGDAGLFTTTQLGSRDVSAHVVSASAPEARLFDLGHADIFHARDAKALFWQAILAWLKAR